MENDSLIRTPKISSVAYTAIITTLVIIGLIYFDSLLKPFVLALMIWFLVKVLKTALEKIRIGGKQLPSGVRSIVATLIISGIIFFIYELISVQIGQISSRSQDYYDKWVDLYSTFSAQLDNPEIMEQFRERVRGFNYTQYVGELVNSLSGFLGDFSVVLIYVIFMLLEEGVTQQKIDRLFPTKGSQYKRFMKLLDEINDSIKKYFSSKTVISLLTAVFSYLVLIIFGVDFPILWAFLIFLFNFIPYIGSFVATLFPAVFSVFQFGDPWYLLYVFAAVETVQIIMGNVVEPKMMGKSLNISPLTVLVSLAVWGYLWGIVGMILAVPITAVGIIILAKFDSTKYLAVLLSEQGEVE